MKEFSFKPISNRSSKWVKVTFREEDLRDLCGLLGRIERGLPFQDNDSIAQQARHFSAEFRKEIKRHID